MSDETRLPGLKTAHILITPTCRANRGQRGAFDEAVARIREQYDKYAASQANADVTWHLALVRDDGEAP